MKDIVLVIGGQTPMSALITYAMAYQAHSNEACNILGAATVSGYERYANWLLNPEWYSVPIEWTRPAQQPNVVPTLGAAIPKGSGGAVKRHGAVVLTTSAQTGYRLLRYPFALRQDDSVTLSLVNVGNVKYGQTEMDWLKKRVEEGSLVIESPISEDTYKKYVLSGNGLRLGEFGFDFSGWRIKNRLTEHLKRLYYMVRKCSNSPEWIEDGLIIPMAVAFWKTAYPNDAPDRFWGRVTQALEWHPNA